METNDTDKYNDEDEIRRPDEIVREQLIPFYVDAGEAGADDDDYECGFALEQSAQAIMCENSHNMLALSEDELNAVLEKSKKEYEDNIEVALAQIWEKEKEERKTRFGNVKKQIARIHKMDRYNTKEYNMILNAITLYEEGEITRFYVETADVFVRIEQILKSLRISKHELEDAISFFFVFDGYSVKTVH